MSQRQHKIARQHNLRELLGRIGSQVKLSEILDVSPSYISQLINGHRAMGDDVASKIEQALSLAPGSLDMPPGQIDDWDPISERGGEVRDEPQEWGSDMLTVPSYFAFAGAGAGTANHEEMRVPGGFWFKRKSLEKAGLIGKGVSCIFAKGNSMEPTIGHGDLLLLEHNVDSISDGSVYAFLWGDDLRCKRLFRRADGQITIRSDNPNKTQYPDETVAADEPGFQVVARVRWRGGWL